MKTIDAMKQALTAIQIASLRCVSESETCQVLAANTALREAIAREEAQTVEPAESQAAFEAWKQTLPDDGCEGPTPFEIWHASRKQALEEAAKVCDLAVQESNQTEDALVGLEKLVSRGAALQAEKLSKVIRSLK